MARLFIGRKTSGGGGLVRVMKNNADDPNTTPSTAVDKFLFDSEVNDLGYAQVTFNLAPGLGNGNYPVGSSDATFKIKKEDSSSGGKWYQIAPNRIVPGYGYPLFTDIRCRNPATGRYRFYDYWGNYVGGNDQYGIFGFGQSGVALTQWRADFATWITGVITGDFAAGANVNNCDNLLVLVWNMPADESDFSPPLQAPAAGQKNVAITPSIVKVARPGFDVATATGRQLIADSNHIPAKLVKSGSIASIPSGGTIDISLGVAVPDDTFVDAQFSQASIADFGIPGISVYDGPWDDRVLDVEYALVGGNTILRIYNNCKFAVKGRYLVFGCGDGQSSGSCPVLRRISGAPDYVQIVRPGAANPPHWDDIILDTRVSYLPLVATGYIPIGAFSASPASENNIYGSLRYTLSLSLPAGTVPYVKAQVLRSYESGGTTINEWRPPIFERIWNGLNSASERRWRNCPIVISGSTVKFYLSPSGRSGYNEDDGYTNSRYAGYRYHIFAVPDSF